MLGSQTQVCFVRNPRLAQIHGCGRRRTAQRHLGEQKINPAPNLSIHTGCNHPILLIWVFYRVKHHRSHWNLSSRMLHSMWES